MNQSSSCSPPGGTEGCEGNLRPARPGVCPINGQPGKPVQEQTVKAMVAVSLRQVNDDQYHFCHAPRCPIVYFSSDGTQTFTVEQVRERVYQKESSTPDVWVCYCFRYGVAQVRNASSATQKQILDDILRGIQAGQCACDLRNPQGSCCLGNMRALMAQDRQSSA